MTMTRRRFWKTVATIASCATLAAAGLACDDKNDVPPEAVAANERAQPANLPASKPTPTTRQLLEGSKTKLRLGDMPLTLEVPGDWGLKSSGEGQFVTINLEGMASSGPVTIQLSARLNPSDSPYNPARINAILAETKKEADARPNPINRVELRDVGPLKVLEQRMISNKDYTGGKPPPDVWGEVEIGEDPISHEKKKVRTVINPTLVRWNFTVFMPTAPGSDKYNARSLTFMQLKLSELEQDREFLERMMRSLKYEE
jgi:hypothetical protein